MENLELIDVSCSLGCVKKLSFGLPVAAISHVSDISLRLQHGRVPYRSSTSDITHSFCHPHCTLCSVCSTSAYYLPVFLFIHLSIPCLHYTLSASSAVSTAHLILSWLNSSLHISALLFISSCKLLTSIMCHCSFLPSPLSNLEI